MITQVFSSSAIETTPFCEKSVPLLRVTAFFLKENLMALVNKIISLVVWIFDTELSYYYANLADFQFHQATYCLSTYLCFGSTVIDFALNRVAKIEEFTIEERNRWLSIATSEIPLRTENLKPKQDGFCLGMSLDFLSEYLQLIKKESLPLDAVKAISPRYVMGPPKKAELTQIFYEALGVFKNTEENLGEIVKTALNTYIQAYENARTSDYKAFYSDYKTILSHITSWRLKTIQSIEDLFGLRMNQEKIHLYKKMTSQSNADFHQLIEDLPNGSYLVLYRSNASAHAQSLIKSGDHYFLFEPSWGTFSFDAARASERLRLMSQSFGLGNACAITFDSCTLS